MVQMIDSDMYERLFRGPGGIRVELDWDAVRSGGWPVDAEVVDTIEGLGGGFFPWYLTNGGREVSYLEDGAQPVPVARVTALESYFDDARRTKIAGMRRSFEHVEAVQLIVPAYSLGASGYLILDGCHRLAALASAGTAFKGLLLTLRGPIDAAVLPDLRHWTAS
jgi:hypothetical protein